MNWMFVVDIAFYALIGFLAFPLFVLIVAHFNGTSFKGSQGALKEYLQEWSDLASNNFLDGMLKVTGITGVLFLLGFGAYLANRIGDAVIPRTSAAFFYFGNDVVRWSVVHEKEWDNVKKSLRTLTKIESSRVDWEQAKAQAGRYDVRFFRASAVITLLIVFSSLFALVKHRTGSRRRLCATLIVGLLGFAGCSAMWVDREHQYIENMLGRFISIHEKAKGEPPEKPKSYPEDWP